MTNTISSLFTAGSAGLETAVDGWIGIGLTITLALIGFALLKKFAPQKKKVV